MTVFITDESARAFWDAACSLAESTQYTRAASLARAATTPEALKRLHVPRAAIKDGVLHVLVGDKANRRSSKHVVSHVCEGELPYGAFRCVSEGVMVASPEFLFLRMARKLTLWEVIFLGFELCGTYVIAPSDGSPAQRHPLTTVAKLRHFVESAGPMPGYRRALKALDYVLERSNSPMESVLAMLLCLPCRYGGFGLPKPKMNHVIKLSSAQAASVGHSMYICDLFWEFASFALEYYGREWHTGVEQVANDSRRMGELQYCGVDIAVVTYEQISSPEQVAALARKVAKRLGVRLRKPNVACVQKRKELHQHLLSSRHV